MIHLRILGAAWRGLARWLIGAAAALAVMAGIGSIYQAAALAKDFRTFPAPGKLVDVGGYRLHIDCTGNVAKGSPTVVFDSGLGAGSMLWVMVQRGLAAHTRACSYDRAGYGWSEPGPSPRTAHQIVGELHSLLDRAGERPPFILVGHSFGSIIVRLYAATYPDEIAGLVLVDPRHEDFFERMPPDFLKVDEANRRTAQLLAVATPVGLTRIAGSAGLLDTYAQYLDPLPPEARAAARATMFYNPRHWQTSLAERDVIEESFDEVRASQLPRDLPLVVLTGADGAEAWQPAGTTLGQPTRDLWMALQREQSTLTGRGRWVVVENSGHYVQLDRPEAVIEAILTLLKP